MLKSMRPLKQHLFDAYGGFADKRYKNLDKHDLFIVDDRDERRDFGADRELYPWFCLMFAKVTGPSSIELIMRGGVPVSPAIRDWAKGDATLTEAPLCLIVPVELGHEAVLEDLADMTQRIVRPGSRYPIPSYKYVCPRVANSLRHLAKTLSSFKENGPASNES